LNVSLKLLTSSYSYFCAGAMDMMNFTKSIQLKPNQSKVKPENQSGLTLLWYWDNLYSRSRPCPQNCYLRWANNRKCGSDGTLANFDPEYSLILSIYFAPGDTDAPTTPT